jgi:hypothetical protein
LDGVEEERRERGCFEIEIEIEIEIHAVRGIN